MWIFLNDAFLSIVEEPSRPDTLLVRARKRGDLERVFPEARGEETPRRDYRFRARIGREQAALALAESVRAIHYPNFKDSVAERSRHKTYTQVWSAMARYQREAALEPE